MVKDTLPLRSQKLGHTLRTRVLRPFFPDNSVLRVSPNGGATMWALGHHSDGTFQDQVLRIRAKAKNARSNDSIKEALRQGVELVMDRRVSRQVQRETMRLINESAGSNIHVGLAVRRPYRVEAERIRRKQAHLGPIARALDNLTRD